MNPQKLGKKKAKSRTLWKEKWFLTSLEHFPSNQKCVSWLWFFFWFLDRLQKTKLLVRCPNGSWILNGPGGGDGRFCVQPRGKVGDIGWDRVWATTGFPSVALLGIWAEVRPVISEWIWKNSGRISVIFERKCAQTLFWKQDPKFRLNFCLKWGQFSVCRSKP